MKSWRSWYGEYRLVLVQDYIHPYRRKFDSQYPFATSKSITLLEWSRVKTCAVWKESAWFVAMKPNHQKKALSLDFRFKFPENTGIWVQNWHTNHFANAHVTSPRDQLRREQVIKLLSKGLNVWRNSSSIFRPLAKWRRWQRENPILTIQLPRWTMNHWSSSQIKQQMMRFNTNP